MKNNFKKLRDAQKAPKVDWKARAMALEQEVNLLRKTEAQLRELSRRAGTINLKSRLNHEQVTAIPEDQRKGLLEQGLFQQAMEELRKVFTAKLVEGRDENDLMGWTGTLTINFIAPTGEVADRLQAKADAMKQAQGEGHAEVQ